MPSAVIRSFHYDEGSRALLIVFQSGRRYRYLDVPSETAQGLRGAFAKGEFFNVHIRGRFAYEEEPPCLSADAPGGLGCPIRKGPP
jgi:KTSC domain